MKTHLFFLLSIFCGLLITSCTKKVKNDWPQWRGPDRDGVSHERNLLKSWPTDGLTLVWSADSLGDGFSSTAVYDKMVFTLGKKDSSELLTALDINGNIKWQKTAGRASHDKDWPQSRSTPTVYEGLVYTLTVHGDLGCYEYKTGKTIWEMKAFEKFEGVPQDGTAESPLVFDNKLIVSPGGAKTTVVALDRLTGKTIWQSESVNDSIYFISPVLFPENSKKAIFVSTLYNDILVNKNSGKIIWKGEHLSGFVPLVINYNIYTGGEYQKTGTMSKWDEEMTVRKTLWKDTIEGNVLAGGVLLKNKLIVAGRERGIYCLDPRTGTPLSKYDSIRYCNLIVADDRLYAYEDQTGKLALFSLEGNNINLVSSFRITKGIGPRIAHLAISEGLLFVRRGQLLMAFDIRQK